MSDPGFQKLYNTVYSPKKVLALIGMEIRESYTIEFLCVFFPVKLNMLKIMWMVLNKIQHFKID